MLGQELVEGVLVDEHQVQGQLALQVSWRLVELDLVLGQRLPLLI